MTGAGSRAPAAVYIEPGSPWENPFIESFNGKLRDELLNVEAFEIAARSPGAGRGLPDRVQHLSATLVSGLPITGRLPGRVDSTTRRSHIDGGTGIGVKSHGTRQ